MSHRRAGFSIIELLIVIAVIFLISHQKLLLRIIEMFRVIRLRLLHWLLDLVPPVLARTNELFTPRPFTRGTALGIVAWSAEAFAFAAALRAAGHATEVFPQPKKHGQQMRYADRQGIPYVFTRNDDGTWYGKRLTDGETTTAESAEAAAAWIAGA